MDISLDALIDFFDSRTSDYDDLAEGIWDFQKDLDSNLCLNVTFFVYEDRVSLHMYDKTAASRLDIHHYDNLVLSLCNVSSVKADTNQLKIITKDKGCFVSYSIHSLRWYLLTRTGPQHLNMVSILLIPIRTRLN